MTCFREESKEMNYCALMSGFNLCQINFKNHVQSIEHPEMTKASGSH